MAFGARLFNGSSDKIDFGTGINKPTAISMSAWVNMSSLVASVSPVLGWSDAGSEYHAIQVNSSGKIGYYVGASGGNVSVDPGTNTLTTGTWVHLALTYDSSAGLKCYFNGANDGTAAANGNLKNAAAASTVVANDPFSRFLAGSIADVAEWNIALSAGEVASLAAGMRPFQIRQQSLIFYAPLDGVNLPEPDLSGFSNNGTLTGTTNIAGPPLMLSTPAWVSPFPSPPAAAQNLMGQIWM